MNMMDCTMAFAVQGQNNIVDCINPETNKSWIQGENLEQIRLRYPGAEIVNINDFFKKICDRENTAITWHKTSKKKYWEMLEVLPPAAMLNGGFLVGEPCDHHSYSGKPRFSAFKQKNNSFYYASRPMTIEEFRVEISK